MVEETVAQQMGMNLTKHQFQTIFHYLFRKIDNKEFRTAFADGLAAKKQMDRSGYILMNCKLYAYACHRAREEGRKRPRAAEYKVAACDAKALRRIDLSHIDAKHEWFTLREFQSILEFLHSKKLEDHIGRYTSRKHAFLIKSYGEERADIRQRLQGKALYELYRRYPFFEDRVHLVNVAKSAIHDSGQDLIKEHTCKSRQRMVKNPDGTYSHVMVPYDSPGLQVEAAPEQDTFVRQGLEALCKIEHKMTPRAKKFLWIMSGQYDKKFSAHLGRDNSDLAERLQFTTYQSKVRRYFGLKQDQVDGFFARLRVRSGWEPRA